MQLTGITGATSVIGVGDIVFLANLSGGQTSQVIISKFMHVPGTYASLLSVSHLDKNGIRTTFSNGVARMMLKADGVLHSQRWLKEINFYSLDGTVMLPVQQPPVALDSVRTFTATLQTWRHRFSHLNPRAIQKVSGHDQLDGLIITGSGCQGASSGVPPWTQESRVRSHPWLAPPGPDVHRTQSQAVWNQRRR